MIEKMRSWLLTFPQWDGGELYLDYVRNVPGMSGLFLQGYEELERGENLLGQLWVRGRWELVLQRITTWDQDNSQQARWIQELHTWIQTQSALGNGPGIGERDVIRAQKGRLKKLPLPAMAVYEITITVESTRRFEA